MGHCDNNERDRKLGAFWERNFCKHAARYGLSFTPLQLGRVGSAAAFQKANNWNVYTLPDVTIWTSPTEHHEVKHKEPTRYGSYGLEKYRFDALWWFYQETGHDVYYTIHNHSLSGGKNSVLDDLRHWFTVPISSLDGRWNYVQPEGDTYRGGKPGKATIYYWDQDLWESLREFWERRTSPPPPPIVSKKAPPMMVSKEKREAQTTLLF